MSSLTLLFNTINHTLKWQCLSDDIASYTFDKRPIFIDAKLEEIWTVSVCLSVHLFLCNVYSHGGTIRPNKKILLFPVTLWDFCWSVSRKNNFFTQKKIIHYVRTFGIKVTRNHEIAIFDNILNLFFTKTQTLKDCLEVLSWKIAKVKKIKKIWVGGFGHGSVALLETTIFFC